MLRSNPADEVPRLVFEEGTLLLPPGRENRPPDSLAPLWQFDPRVGRWRTMAVNYARWVDEESFESKYLDEVAAWEAIPFDRHPSRPLRDYQQQAVEDWFAARRRGIVNLATGLGKTEVALSIMSRLGCSTLVVAPVRDLMYQWHRRIQEALGYDAGLIGDNHYSLRSVCCTTYKSAAIHMAKLGNRFKLIIFDECHHLPAGKLADAALLSAAPSRLGLSATLSLDQEVKLSSLIGPIVARGGLSEAAGAYLAEYETFRIPVELSAETRREFERLGKIVSQYRRTKLDENASFQWQDLCKEARNSKEAREILLAYRQRRRIEERAPEKLRIVEDLLELHGRIPTLIFTGSNAMAFDVSRRFLLPLILSHTLKNERREILERFAQGVYPAIVANEVLDEGVDLPAAKVAIVLGGRRGHKQAIQRLGRVLRRKGTERAILYEIFCEDTKEEAIAKARRQKDAYERSRHLRI